MGLKELLTVTGVMLAAVVFIIYQDWFLSVGTCYVLEWRTFKWDNLNDVVLDAPRHGAVTQDESLVGLVIKNILELGKLIDCILFNVVTLKWQERQLKKVMKS